MNGDGVSGCGVKKVGVGRALGSQVKLVIDCGFGSGLGWTLMNSMRPSLYALWCRRRGGVSDSCEPLFLLLRPAACGEAILSSFASPLEPLGAWWFGCGWVLFLFWRIPYGPLGHTGAWGGGELFRGLRISLGPLGTRVPGIGRAHFRRTPIRI
jgi:hypothetical protein